MPVTPPVTARRRRGGRRALAGRRRRGARPAALLHHRHALAQEADQLLLLAQVGEQAVEGAGQGADLVAACPPRPRPRTSRRARAPRGPPAAHGPGDARGRRGRRRARPSDHHHQRDQHQAVAEAAEGRHLLGHAAQRQHASPPSRRWPPSAGPATPTWRSPPRSSSKVARLARRGAARAGQSAAASAASFGPSDETESCGGWPGAVGQVGDLAVGELADVAGQRLVDAVAGDEHALEVRARDCMGTETAWKSRSPCRQTVADSSPSSGFITSGSFERSSPCAAGPVACARSRRPSGSVAMKKSAFSSWLRSLQRVEDRWPGRSVSTTALKRGRCRARGCPA